MTLVDALEAHETALTKGGGRRGTSSIDNVEGALGRPYHGYHRPISRKAAALLHGMATSHGFIDGNKRTAWLVTQVLIVGSGYQLKLRRADQIDDVVVAIVEGEMTEDELGEWFKSRLARAVD